MRDPERIEKITNLLRVAWSMVPSWRLGQLISNLQGPGQQDVFHPEDDDWEMWLKQFIKDHEIL